MIKSELKKVRDLLGESLRYVVPDYQRNYEWKKEQGEEFWEDLQNGQVFLGTLVLDTSNLKESEIKIVDGQQRITTIFILLAACRYQAKKINSQDQASVIQNKISFIDDTSGKASSSKLIPSPSIREVFLDTITNDKWDGRQFESRNKKRQINRIKPLYDFFIDRIAKFDKDQISDLLKRLYDSTFVRIDIEETQEAFDIFERTNARGLELNASDLLKNYLFSKNASENLEEEWEEIVENSSKNLLRMIKYFYVSKFGPVLKKDLFKSLKKYGEEIGANKLLKEIKEFSFFYSLVLEGSFETIIKWAQETENKFFLKEYNARQLNRTLDAIKLFGVTQGYPLVVKILTFISSVDNEDLKDKLSNKFLSFLNTIEKFHFLNYAIAQRPGNQIENYYANKCKTPINRRNVLEVMADTKDELLRENKVVGEAEFMEKFSALSYSQDFNLIYYIFDRMNNLDRKGGQYIEIYNPDKKLLRRNYDIDHLVSQNLDNYDFDEEALQETIDNIGNLLVISKHTNGGLQNSVIKDKIKVIEEKEVQNLPEARNLIKLWETKKWDKTEDVVNNVSDRAKDLAKRAFSVVWKI